MTKTAVNVSVLWRRWKMDGGGRGSEKDMDMGWGDTLK